MKSLLKPQILASIVFLSILPAQWKTCYEQSDYKRTPRYNETVLFTKKLAEHFLEAAYTSFGKSAQKRDLPLLIVDKEGFTDPEKVRGSGRLVVLVQAGIHSGESDGKDAGLVLFRDLLADGKNKQWLEKITFLFIPIFNVDGHERFGPYNRINQNGPEEMGWRVTSQNLNLNRDYLKNDTPEMQAWTELYQRWLPEFFIDCHVTDGADYQYAITYAVETDKNMDENVSAWLKDTYIPRMTRAMAEKNFPTFPYIFFMRSHDVKSGVGSWAASPRYSQGYAAVMNRPGLLIETHMLKDYKTRVNATIAMLESTFEVIFNHSEELSAAIQKADSGTSLPVFRRKPLPLRFNLTKDSVMVDFLGYEYEKVKSGLTDGWWYRYSHTPKTFRIPRFSKLEVTESAALPAAYIIPVQWDEVIKRLKINGVKFLTTENTDTLRVTSIRLTDFSFPDHPFEGRFRPQYSFFEFDTLRAIPSGSILIPVKQLRARLIANALEPGAPDSYLAWGLFNAVFEQKEYFETYVMETMARDMLKKNPALKIQYEKYLRDHPEKAGNQRSKLDWFYRRTPYFDLNLGLYPVMKVYDEKYLEQIISRTKAAE